MHTHVQARRKWGPSLRLPSGLSLEQARELGRGNVIHQLQQNYQTLSNEVAQITVDLRQVLTHLREDPGGGHRRAQTPPIDEPSPTQSSSSQDEICPRRERRPPRQPADDLRDMNIDPLELKKA